MIRALGYRVITLLPLVDMLLTLEYSRTSHIQERKKKEKNNCKCKYVYFFVINKYYSWNFEDEARVSIVLKRTSVRAFPRLNY